MSSQKTNEKAKGGASANAKAKEDTVIGVIAGGLGTVGFSALYEYLRRKASEFVVQKATEVFVDRGRGPILRDILALPEEQSNQLLKWFNQAQKEGKEGKYVNLILKLPDHPTEGRRKELAKLSQLGSYEKFVETLMILEQDNAVQIAQRVIVNGGHILDTDLKKVREGVGTIARKIDEGTRDAAPTLHEFADWIRTFKR